MIIIGQIDALDDVFVYVTDVNGEGFRVLRELIHDPIFGNYYQFDGIFASDDIFEPISVTTLVNNSKALLDARAKLWTEKFGDGNCTMRKINAMGIDSLVKKIFDSAVSKKAMEDETNLIETGQEINESNLARMQKKVVTGAEKVMENQNNLIEMGQKMNGLDLDQMRKKVVTGILQLYVEVKPTDRTIKGATVYSSDKFPPVLDSNGLLNKLLEQKENEPAIRHAPELKFGVWCSQRKHSIDGIHWKIVRVDPESKPKKTVTNGISKTIIKESQPNNEITSKSPPSVPSFSSPTVQIEPKKEPEEEVSENELFEGLICSQNETHFIVYIPGRHWIARLDKKSAGKNSLFILGMWILFKIRNKGGIKLVDTQFTIISRAGGRWPWPRRSVVITIRQSQTLQAYYRLMDWLSLVLFNLAPILLLSVLNFQLVFTLRRIVRRDSSASTGTATTVAVADDRGGVVVANVLLEEGHGQQTQQQHQQRLNANAMLFAVVLLLFVCIGPQVPARILYEWHGHYYNTGAVLYTCISQQLVFLNASLNFCLYCLVSRRYRALLRDTVLRLLRHCHWRPKERTRVAKLNHQCRRQRQSQRRERQRQQQSTSSSTGGSSRGEEQQQQRGRTVAVPLLEINVAKGTIGQ